MYTHFENIIDTITLKAYSTTDKVRALCFRILIEYNDDNRKILRGILQAIPKEKFTCEEVFKGDTTKFCLSYPFFYCYILRKTS